MLKEKIHLVIVKDSDALTDHQAEKLLRLCCPQTKQRLEKRKGSRLKQGLAADMALQYALYQGAGLLPYSYQIAYTVKGKPYVEDNPSLFISKTHSGSYGAAAVGRTSLGIDIQQKIPFREALAEKLCSLQEKALLSDTADKDVLLTQLFCCKEAFGKTTGQGLTGCRGVEMLQQEENIFSCQDKRCFTWWENTHLFCLCTEETRWEKTEVSVGQLSEWLEIQGTF